MKTDPRRGETATKPGVFPSTSFGLEEPSILVIDPRRRDREKRLRRLIGLFAEGARFLSAASGEGAARGLGRGAGGCILVRQRRSPSRPHRPPPRSRAGAAGTTGVLLIGLDEFKAINSSFGHGMGDELLRVVAGRLRHCVRNVDTIARWGGGEFAALLQEMSRPGG